MYHEAEQDRPDASRSDARPRRRRRGLSLRALMLLVLAAGGWIGWICYRARVQRAAVDAIERKEFGEVIFDWQWDSAAAFRRTDSPEPGWLTKQLGLGFFEEAMQVLVAGGADDSTMFHIGHLTYLEYLYLWNSNVTDSGAAQIRKLRRLRTLIFQSAPAITAKGVANVNGLNRLEFLWLPRQADDACLAAIRDVPALTALLLPNARVTDAGAEHLRRLTTLTELNLDETGITDNGLKFVAQLSRLQHLSLRNTRITDTGLAAVGRLTRLESLALDDTAVTDAGLSRLAGLTKCQEISVGGTNVTPAGIAAMKAKCPWIAVVQMASP
jgi:hypothetical protein